MNVNLATDAKWLRISNAVAAGTTAINCTVVDTAGYNRCAFMVAFGTLTATAATDIKVQSSTVVDGTGDAFADLTGTKISIADDQDNKMLIVEVDRPVERFLRLVIGRATANAVVDGAFAILTGGGKYPVTQDTGSVPASGNEYWYQPAEGTA